MVNVKAVKRGLLVGGGIFALLFIGTVWRFVSRLVSFAVLALFVVVVAYVAYELYAGWARADEGETSSESDGPLTEADGVTDSTPDATDTDSISDDELDRELERLREETRDTDPEVGAETEN